MRCPKQYDKAAGSFIEPAALSYCFGQRTVVFSHFAVPEGDQTARRRATGRAARSGGPLRSGSARTGRSSRSRPAYSAGHQAAERATCRRQAGARSPRHRRTGAKHPARVAEPRRARPYRSRRGAEKENAPSGHEVFKAFRDGGFNDDLRLVSSSVKHNGMVLSRIAPLYTLKRKCKSYRSMRKQTKRRRSVHFFLTG